jgi:hypothetical protein
MNHPLSILPSLSCHSPLLPKTPPLSKNLFRHCEGRSNLFNVRRIFVKVCGKLKDCFVPRNYVLFLMDAVVV